ncbi:MAG TPA: hypothetical protein VG032_03900 [Acidimicrobiales bacterium]|nr:hypothetical protein [Acidimicrobiales bacterium]
MSRLRQLKKHTRALLSDLGDSPDLVAASLQAAGVKGIPKDNRSCAVALYLSAQMGTEAEVRAITVGHCSMLITLVNPHDSRPAGRLLIQLSKPMRRFVAAFDAMQYPMITRNSTGTSRPEGNDSKRARRLEVNSPPAP